MQHPSSCIDDGQRNEIQNEPIYKESILFIDSSKASGTNTDFYVGLNEDGSAPGKKFTNVKSIELIEMSLSDQYIPPTNEQYFIINISELEGSVLSNIPYANGQFAIMYYKSILLHDFDNKKKEFETPLSSLSRLSIKLLSGTTGMAIADQGLVTMVFKIKYKY